MTDTQQDAFEKILGLRHQSRISGMITTRAQNVVLGALKDDDLAVVCRELLRRGDGPNQ